MVTGIMACLCIVVIMTCASSFSVLVADDFSHASSIGVFRVPFREYLAASFRYACKVYKNWQGTYFAMFIQALLSPANNYGFSQLRIVMVANTLLFFAAFAFLIYSFTRSLGREAAYLRVVVIFLAFFCVCGYTVYPEIFFWFSGAASYTIPLSCLMIGLSLLYPGVDDRLPAGCMIGSILFGAMAMGGSLAVSGTGCYAAVLGCVYLLWSRRRLPIRHIIVTMVWVICAGVNAMAPGNYVRHGHIDDTGLHPITALISAVDMVADRGKYLIRHTRFVGVLIVAVILGIIAGRLVEHISGDSQTSSGDRISRVVIAVLGLITPVVGVFPVMLGAPGNDIAERCVFVMDLSILLSFLHLCLLIGVYSGRYISETKAWIAYALLAVMAIASMVVVDRGIGDITVLHVGRELAHGIYSDHFNECKDFIESMDRYEPGEDVRIPESEFPRYIENTYNFYLTDDPEEWVNVSFAEYYGFGSIMICPISASS